MNEVFVVHDDMFSLSASLRGDAARFTAGAQQAIGLVTGTQAYGLDPRNVPAAAAARRHGEAGDEARRLIERVAEGLTDMGRSAAAVTVAFGDQDGLNAASVDAVAAVVNRPRGER